MKSIFSRNHVFLSLSLATMAVLATGLSAVSQTVETTSSEQLTQSNGTEASPNPVSPEVETFTPYFSTETLVNSTVPAVKEAPAPDSSQQQLPTQETTVASVVTPIPGTTATSSAALAPQNAEANQLSAPNVAQANSSVAQANIAPGRPTRGGSSYIGIAGNIGLGGDSALGDGNFMVISKIGLTNAISVRPAAVIGDNTVILVPVTYDFSFSQLADPFTEALPIAPYVGAGAAIETGDETDFSFLITGGVDVPITRQFTATAAVNAAFFDETDIGFSVGVGYNFSAF